MTKCALLGGLLCLWTVSTNVWAQDEGSFVNYENIVSELNASVNDVPEPAKDEYDWAEVALHGSIAFAGSYLSTTTPNGTSGSGLLKGFELSGGANLFSRKARGELAFRDFSQEGMSRDLKAELKEIEARLVFMPILKDKMLLRMGPGLTSRHLDLVSTKNGKTTKFSSSTPSLLLLVGFERKVSPGVSVGPDIAYRSPIGSSSIDKSGFDASFRLNATF